MLEKNPLKSICKLAVFRAEGRIIYFQLNLRPNFIAPYIPIHLFITAKR